MMQFISCATQTVLAELSSLFHLARIPADTMAHSRDSDHAVHSS